MAELSAPMDTPDRERICSPTLSVLWRCSKIPIWKAPRAPPPWSASRMWIGGSASAKGLRRSEQASVSMALSRVARAIRSEHSPVSPRVRRVRQRREEGGPGVYVPRRKRHVAVDQIVECGFRLVCVCLAQEGSGDETINPVEQDRGPCVCDLRLRVGQ